MNKLTEQKFTRKPDGGLAEQIEVLEAMAEGDADNTELLMLLIELLSLREQLAELKALPPVAWRHDTDVVSNRLITVSEVNMQSWIDKGYDVMPLFTAAKPAED